MPTLNWIGKDKIVNHDKEVSFRLLKKNKKYSLGESENLIVEGDNLEALKALMPFITAVSSVFILILRITLEMKNGFIMIR